MKKTTLKVGLVASMLALGVAARPALAQEVTTVRQLRLQVDAIKASSPERFTLIDPDVARLERKQSWARAAVVGGLALGAGVLVVGIAMTPKCPSGPYGETAEMTVARVNRCQDSDHAHFTRVTAMSIVAAVPGLILYGILRPSSADVRRVAEKHGLSRPQLALNLGRDNIYGASVHVAY
jgi:hypothetical protein